MGADVGRRGLERIEESHAIGLAHTGELFGRQPLEPVNLGSHHGRRAPADSTSKDEGENGAIHALVDTCYAERPDAQAGFLCYLSDQALLYRLVQLEDS